MNHPCSNYNQIHTSSTVWSWSKRGEKSLFHRPPTPHPRVSSRCLKESSYNADAESPFHEGLDPLKLHGRMRGLATWVIVLTLLAEDYGKPLNPLVLWCARNDHEKPWDNVWEALELLGKRGPINMLLIPPSPCTPQDITVQVPAETSPPTWKDQLSFRSLHLDEMSKVLEDLGLPNK